MGGLHYM